MAKINEKFFRSGNLLYPIKDIILIEKMKSEGAVSVRVRLRPQKNFSDEIQLEGADAEALIKVADYLTVKS